MAGDAQQTHSASEPDPQTGVFRRLRTRLSQPAPGGQNTIEPHAALERALEEDKREGLKLAVRARWCALAAIAVLVVSIDPSYRASYYLVLLLGFAAIGWFQLKIGKVGHNRAELRLMAFDLALMTVVMLVPNPFLLELWPPTMQFHYGNFVYFYVLLAAATLAYSWRTLFAMGIWTALFWAAGVTLVSFIPVSDPQLRADILSVLSGHQQLQSFLDPYNIHLPGRFQEVVVFLIVAGILAVNGWRNKRLLIKSAEVERERGNLARYFSPNVVEELSQNDEPLKRVRTQKVAVLFVDIVGFTTYSNGREPAQVIQTLREFHARMEEQVFAHNGTLDKYLGDGLMATFGTPIAGQRDASNALDCAMAMVDVVKDWNAQREAQGEKPMKAGFGIHYGEVVLGNIGTNRMEFTVIGDTVNTASRLENLTRRLGTPLVVSDALMQQVLLEDHEEEAQQEVSAKGSAGSAHARPELTSLPAQEIRGLDAPMALWTWSV
ncbi:adenylate/guanylate cyclase domain-containing protein [Rhodovibrionaceae bacterium A322]